MEIKFFVDGSEAGIDIFEDEETIKAAKEFKANIEKELTGFKCDEHDEDVSTVIFYMTQPDVDSINSMEVFGCCDDFKMSVIEKITVE
ncbi:hypothetical protein ACFL6G_06445 [candidate division KSB1 bacterium]